MPWSWIDSTGLQPRNTDMSLCYIVNIFQIGSAQEARRKTSLAENTSNIDTGVSDDDRASEELVLAGASSTGKDRAVIKKRRRHA